MKINSYNNIVITAANSLYFDTLVTLIASIHRTSYNTVDRIIIYDLGLNDDEIFIINSYDKCEVISFNLILPILPFDDYLLPKGHAYKCFCLYHAKDLGSNILWLDAGVMLLKNIQEIYDFINNENIFVVGDLHLNVNFTKPSCVNIMSATENELNDVQISSGILGYKSYGKYQNLFNEAYEYSIIKDCVVGDENNHRHDQSVYSILVSRYGIKKYNIDIYGYWTDSNRTLETAIKNNAVIFVHRRGHNDKTGLINK